MMNNKETRLKTARAGLMQAISEAERARRAMREKDTPREGKEKALHHHAASGRETSGSAGPVSGAAQDRIAAGEEEAPSRAARHGEPLPARTAPALPAEGGKESSAGSGCPSGHWRRN